MMSGSEHEEAIWRITEQYVRDLKTGRQPRLSDYLARYPHYAAAISEFVAYYQAVELQQTEESLEYAPASYESRALLERVLLQTPLSTEPLCSLLPTDHKHLTLKSLAYELDVSEDIVLLLEQRVLTEESLPALLIERLTFALHRSEQEIRTYLRESVSADRRRSGPDYQRYVAEETVSYAYNRSTLSAQGFLQALEESEQATQKQKKFWREIVKNEARQERR